MNLSITAALLGVLLAGSILYLVRRDHLHGIQAVFWLLVAGTALFIGLFPKLVDRIGVAFGVQYPPMLLVMLAVIGVLIKLVVTDIELARKERRLRRLTQKLALLEHELQIKAAAEAASSSHSEAGDSASGKRAAG